MRNSIDRTPPGLDEVASVVERLAVLLSAGVPPAAAWGYVAEVDSRSQVNVRDVVGALNAGVGIGDAILRSVPADASGLGDRFRRGRGTRPSSRGADASAWQGLAAAWIVATDAGAPLAPSLRELSASLRMLAQTRQDAETALSGPVATARLVVVLPIVGIFFGMALGFDSLGVLVTTVPGFMCLASGSTLLWIARRWNRKLVGAASVTNLTPGLSLDLLAIAVSGGASIDRARLAVSRALTRSGLSAAVADGDMKDAEAVLSLSERAGVPAGTLLRSEAQRLRRQARGIAERKASTLAVTLMLPLGLCVLPAFMLLGVAPLMITILSSTIGGY
ncbi:MAG: type II secretion system F family protein [Terrimesophilobacter sp.]